MKKNILLPLLLVFCLALLSFNSKKSNLTIEQALIEKKIAVVILPTGGHSGNCINIKVENLTNKNLNLVMPVGTLFEPENTEEQSLITTEEILFALEKNASKKIKVYAYCTEATDKCPKVASKFNISHTANEKLQGLVHFLDSLKPDYSLIQGAVWCVTDSASVSNIYDIGDIKATKALRAYICAVTGQKDTWYHTNFDYRVDANRNIVHVAKEVKGDLEFVATSAVELQGVIKDSLGTVIFTNPNKLNCPAGKIKFEFKLNVHDWTAGQYYVVYTNNGVEVINQAFSF
jgi:hypothetical protein